MSGMVESTSAPAQRAPERGETLRLALLAWGRLGEALSTYNGRDVFVFGGIPGETVDAEVVAVRRKYIAAQVTRVITGVS